MLTNQFGTIKRENGNEWMEQLSGEALTPTKTYGLSILVVEFTEETEYRVLGKESLDQQMILLLEIDALFIVVQEH